MKVLLVILLLWAVVACTTISPRDLVGDDTPPEELALIWFPQGTVSLMAVNGERLNISPVLGYVGDRMYIKPGKVTLWANRDGDVRFDGINYYDYPDLNVEFMLEVKSNRTYLLSDLGEACPAVLCLYLVGEDVELPKQPLIHSNAYDELVQKSAAGEIVAVPR